jgi:hypothetical protein
MSRAGLSDTASTGRGRLPTSSFMPRPVEDRVAAKAVRALALPRGRRDSRIERRDFATATMRGRCFSLLSLDDPV